MSQGQRRAMIDREHPHLSLVHQCALLNVSRSSLYYQPTEASAQDLELMTIMDRQYLKTPFYGSRRMTAWLRTQGHQVSRKRVRRLVQVMGLEAIYRRPNPDASGQAIPWAPSIPLPVTGAGDQPGQPRLGRRYHLHTHGAGLPVPGGHHGLA